MKEEHYFEEKESKDDSLSCQKLKKRHQKCQIETQFGISNATLALVLPDLSLKLALQLYKYKKFYCKNGIGNAKMRLKLALALPLCNHNVRQNEVL
jgi:hypothetical protein